MMPEDGVSTDVDVQQESFDLEGEAQPSADEDRPFEGSEAAEAEQAAMREHAASEAESAIADSLVTLGYVAFDSASTDSTSTNVMVSEEHRAVFRRDAYVGIKDDEQHLEFLGRVVEGPFHAPHEIAADSAVGR